MPSFPKSLLPIHFIFISVIHFYWASTCNYYPLTFMPLRQADMGFLQDKLCWEKGCLKAWLTSLSFTAACIYGNDFIIQDAGMIATPLCSDRTWLTDQFSLKDDKYCSLVSLHRDLHWSPIIRPVKVTDKVGIHLWAHSRVVTVVKMWVLSTCHVIITDKRTVTCNLKIRLLFIFSHYFGFDNCRVCVCVAGCKVVRVWFWGT